LRAASGFYASRRRMTIALDGHADVNSTDVRTSDGTSPRSIRSNPNLGKYRSAVVVSK
jgi:hypothetical protein